MNKSKIEAIEKLLADAQSNVAELKAQLVDAEKDGDSCSDWLLSEGAGIRLHGDGRPTNPLSKELKYQERGRAFDTIEQAKQLDDNQLLYMRIVRAIAAENKKVGYVAYRYSGQRNYVLCLDCGAIKARYWEEIQYLPVHYYMHESAVPKIREQFSDEELTTFITKGMLL